MENVSRRLLTLAFSSFDGGILRGWADGFGGTGGMGGGVVCLRELNTLLGGSSGMKKCGGVFVSGSLVM